MTNIEMGPRHDWLGVSAEAYVGYCFAREKEGSRDKFEVFGASKWEADVVAHDLVSDKWWRIEVKSTDGKGWPWARISQKKRKKIFQRSELYAEVRIRNSKIEFRLVKVPPDRDPKKFKRLEKRAIRKEGDLRAFLST